MNKKNGSEKITLILITLFSGSAALIYETLWTREFSLIIGSTVGAASLTFASFLTGLALGAFYLGRWIETNKNPLFAYFCVEVFIGLASLGIGILFRYYLSDLTSFIIPFHSSHFSFFYSVIAFILVLIPTFFMGGTLPLLLVCSRNFSGTRSFMGKVYAFNTLGGAIGTLMCGFYLIRVYGMMNSLYIGVILNGFAALCCLLLQLRQGSDQKNIPSPSVLSDSGSVMHFYPRESVLMFMAIFSGVCTLGLEVVWIRLGNFFLGNRIFVFSLILASVLIILALGAWIASRMRGLIDRYQYFLFGGLLFLSGLGIKISSMLFSWWIVNQNHYETIFPQINSLLILYRCLELWILLAPPLLPLGVLFPLTLLFSENSLTRTGAMTGKMYLVNTLGCVLGSLWAGFYGMVYLGSLPILYLFHFVCIISAVLFFIYSGHVLSDGKRLMWCGIILSLLVMKCGNLNQLVLVREDSGGELLHYEEDEYGIFKILKLKNGHLKVTNNRTELVFHLGSIQTSYVQEMQAHLGMFFCPEALKVLVIGSGYGITAGTFTLYPTVERIDAVEILPAMIKNATAFEPFNFSYHQDKRVNLIQDDGRYYLQNSKMKYDIISVNITDPHLPGASSFFHKEFYELAKQHLNKNGVVIQHAFGQEKAIVLKTLKESFSHLHFYSAYGNGYNVVASADPLFLDESKVRSLLSEQKLSEAFRNLGFIYPLDVVRVYQTPLNPEGLWDESTPIATDNYPLIEFAWDKNLYKNLFSNE